VIRFASFMLPHRMLCDESRYVHRLRLKIVTQFDIIYCLSRTDAAASCSNTDEISKVEPSTIFWEGVYPDGPKDAPDEGVGNQQAKAVSVRCALRQLPFHDRRVQRRAIGDRLIIEVIPVVMHHGSVAIADRDMRARYALHHVGEVL
jgi:hypothetical protein